MYVCGAVNGADTTDGDPVLLRAGFLVAQGFVTDPDVQSVLADALDLPAGEARSVARLKDEIAAFVSSPAVLAAACSTLVRLRWFLALDVTECRDWPP